MNLFAVMPPSPGQDVLTGSQSYLLQEQIRQSLAGRVSLLELSPFSLAEIPCERVRPNLDAVLFRGGFPAVVARDLPPVPWYSSYIATYVERDVRQTRQRMAAVPWRDLPGSLEALRG